MSCCWIFNGGWTHFEDNCLPKHLFSRLISPTPTPPLFDVPSCPLTPPPPYYHEHETKTLKHPLFHSSIKMITKIIQKTSSKILLNRKCSPFFNATKKGRFIDPKSLLVLKVQVPVLFVKCVNGLLHYKVGVSSHTSA